MDWQKVINNGSLFYASKPQDTQLRIWSLKDVWCDVAWYDTYPLEDIDIVICTILNQNEGELSEIELATILGFNVVDNFAVSPKRYADRAELTMFRKIAQRVIDWGLVKRDVGEDKSATYSLTQIGETAISKGSKFKFYNGTLVLHENFGICTKQQVENEFFPFKTSLGLSCTIIQKTELDFDKVPSDFYELDDSQLSQRMLLQHGGNINLYSANATNRFDITSCSVDYRIYLFEGDYFPIVFVNDVVSQEATDLINQPYNRERKEIKVEWGKYLRLLQDSSTIIDYEAISPFLDILSLKDILNDKIAPRLIWSDNMLFNHIANTANANDWQAISRLCPAGDIECHINDFHFWDWSTLSAKLSPKFITAHPNDYKWDFSVISNRDDFSAEDFRCLLDSVSSPKAEWDWDILLPLLGNQYIVDNIERLDFDLTEFTKNEIELSSALLKLHPEKRWDYDFVSSEYDLAYIIENISLFNYTDDSRCLHNRLNLLKVIRRAFTSQEYSELFCSSHAVLKTYSENISTLAGYSANQENFIWNDRTIRWMESLDLIQWGGGRYTKGFEFNPRITWNSAFFEAYNNKVTSSSGTSYISSKIQDPDIVAKHPEYPWDWKALSSNEQLIKNADFVCKNLEDLDLNVLLPLLNDSIVNALFEEYGLTNHLNTSLQWKYATQKATIEFVRKNIDLQWNWTILTKRFHKTIKISAIGNSRWVNKWDWSFLTKNLDIAQIVDYLDEYKEHWDWEHLTTALGKSFVLDNLAEYHKYWDWTSLLTDILDKDELAINSYLPAIGTCLTDLPKDEKASCWTIITKRFSYEELDDLIRTTSRLRMPEVFSWDYLDFYNREEFNLREYLANDVDLIDWTALSSCRKIEEEFSWDSRLFSEKIWLEDVSIVLKNEDYQWDFKELSRVPAFYDNQNILSIHPALWDWTYICANSSLFERGENFKRIFNRFAKHLDYKVLSARIDTGLTESIIGSKIEKEWDWAALSSNRSLIFSIDFIKKNRDKSWDWECISSRTDILLDNDSLYELSDKKWSWEALSNRNDITYDEEFFKRFMDKPLNWFNLSKSDSFVPNASTLSKLKGKVIDWKAISSNAKLDKSVLWDYRELLDWKLVTARQTDCSDSDFLEKYRDYLDWDFISTSPAFVVSDDNLERFKNNVIWWQINKREDFKITEKSLSLFTEELDWRRASESHSITFTEELIEKYRDKWEWSRLRKNSQIIDHLGNSLSKYQAEFNCSTFVEQFDRTPYIYHFTHMFPNAVDIIKSRRILCRNKSNGHFANAAGNNVHRRATAHNFARFYYRPQTPTQFYNECLGMDKESGYLKTWRYYGEYFEKWKSYYPQALQLGLPKCPMPVFFKFSLEEIISKMPDKCYYSTGNMQTDWADVVKVTECPNRLNVDHVYSTIKDGVEIYKQYSQQEFLVEDFFDFSKLNSFEIICYDEEQAELLKAQLVGDPICKKISSNGCGIYHRNNRELRITEDDLSISFVSEYRDSNASFRISGNGLKDATILNPDDISRETDTYITSYPRLTLKKPLKEVEISFVDEKSREWVVYSCSTEASNSAVVSADESPLGHFMGDPKLKSLFDSLVRHYSIKKHTQLVCEQFHKYFGNTRLPISSDLMTVFLTLHDIGKPLAEHEGDRSKQHHFTYEIIKNLSLDCCGNHYTDKDRKIILALSSSDCLGEYFTGNTNSDETITTLSELADNAGMKLKDFLYIFMVYYQCDTASYTADAGGLRYLEHLFEYSDSVTKKFDDTEGLIKMTGTYWDKYIELKQLANDRENM